jgi:hypothetical protein
MAEGKNKIIVYKDWLNNFEDLTDEELGKLMRHFFEYVNDLNPVLEDRILNIAWRPIEATLKRDLKAWEAFVDKQKGNGSKGGRPPKAETQTTQITQAFIEEPKKPVSDSVSVSVNERESDIKTPAPILQLPIEDLRDLPEPPGASNNKPKDRAELWELVREKSQGIGFTEAMVKAYSKQIEECYRDEVDGVWRRSSDGVTALNNWRKQITTQWLTDLKMEKFKNEYVKLKPQEMVASLPKSRTN